MIGLAIVGREALRRQTAEGFPDAHAGDVRLALAAMVRRAQARVTREHEHNGGSSWSPAPQGDRVDQFERRASLHGALSDEEFALEKTALRSAQHITTQETQT